VDALVAQRSQIAHHTIGLTDAQPLPRCLCDQAQIFCRVVLDGDLDEFITDLAAYDQTQQLQSMGEEA